MATKQWNRQQFYKKLTFSDQIISKQHKYIGIMHIVP